MTDVELTGFGSVTAHHLPFGLEEVEMVGKERVVDEDGVLWGFKLKSSPSRYFTLFPLGFSYSSLLWVVSDGSRWWI